jgi:D-serine deaminase-like pyridoxal phosphate-dependent protein
LSTLAQAARRLDHLPCAGPHLVVDEARARANIAAMAAKAARSGVRLRPHFKTHDSVGVGRWFREAGVTGATVSSLAMAERFVRDGWTDLTLAVLVNPRELPRLGELAWELAARGGGLGLLADTPEAARAVRHISGDTARLWLKVDTGYGRTGVAWDDAERLRSVADAAAFAGLLTHAGHSYHAPPEQLPGLFAETARRLAAAREATGRNLLLSTGDTPTCTAVEAFSGVDEVRPGNFVFYDVMQRAAGVAADEQLALGVACPVIALDPARGRIVLHGGSVHLSREFVGSPEHPAFGYALLPDETGFGQVLEQAPVIAVSQEHGVIGIDPGRWHDLARGLVTGDRVLIAPVHACLACNLHDTMTTLAGTAVPRDVGGSA